MNINGVIETLLKFEPFHYTKGGFIQILTSHVWFDDLTFFVLSHIFVRKNNEKRFVQKGD